LKVQSPSAKAVVLATPFWELWSCLGFIRDRSAFGLRSVFIFLNLAQGASAALFDSWPTPHGIPSIVTGVFVYTIVVVPLKHFSALAGGIALALIMVPIIARTQKMSKLVPHSLPRRGAGVGAPQWRVTSGLWFRQQLRDRKRCNARHSRISGETAPLCLPHRQSLLSHYLDQPIASATVQIYNYAISPYDEWHAQAWAGDAGVDDVILSTICRALPDAKKVLRSEIEI